MSDPAQGDPMPSYRQRVLKCLNDNLATDAVWGMGRGAAGGALAGAYVGGTGGAPFAGVGAVPGAVAGGLAGAAIGGASGGIGAIANDFGRCILIPNGMKVR